MVVGLFLVFHYTEDMIFIDPRHPALLAAVFTAGFPWSKCLGFCLLSIVLQEYLNGNSNSWPCKYFGGEYLQCSL